MGSVSLYCRGLGGECEDGYGTLRGESGSTCDITILMMGTRESVAPLGLSHGGGGSGEGGGILAVAGFSNLLAD
jgi:hypothetical protein